LGCLCQIPSFQHDVITAANTSSHDYSGRIPLEAPGDESPWRDLLIGRNSGARRRAAAARLARQDAACLGTCVTPRIPQIRGTVITKRAWSKVRRNNTQTQSAKCISFEIARASTPRQSSARGSCSYSTRREPSSLQAACRLRCLYNREIEIPRIALPRYEKKLLVILSKEESKALLQAPRSLGH
jgi:hypothetical protein